MFSEPPSCGSFHVCSRLRGISVEGLCLCMDGWMDVMGWDGMDEWMREGSREGGMDGWMHATLSLPLSLSLSLSFCIYIHTPIYLSALISICNLSVNSTVYLSTCLSIEVSTYQTHSCLRTRVLYIHAASIYANM